MSLPPHPLEPQSSSEPFAPPPCVMAFNASDPSGASGLSSDVATLAAMGTHALPVVSSILMRDTAEVFDVHVIDSDVIMEQARAILEDVQIAGWKVGFLGDVEGISAVAEILTDYPDVPLVAYMPSLSWMEDEEGEDYLQAFKDLILPQSSLLVGNVTTLSSWLLPEWDQERLPSAREIAVAAAEHGAPFTLITGLAQANQQMANVLVSPEGIVSTEKFDHLEVSFIGAGDTLSAALAGMLAQGADLAEATKDGLAFLEQALAAGFRPGMGQVVPDRFFWAHSEDDDDDDEAGDAHAYPTPPTLQ